MVKRRTFSTAHLSFLVDKLYSNEFSSNEDQVVHPVVLDRVVILVSLEVFPDVSTDTLVNPPHIPGQGVHHPEVGSFVEDG